MVRKAAMNQIPVADLSSGTVQLCPGTVSVRHACCCDHEAQFWRELRQWSFFNFLRPNRERNHYLPLLRLLTNRLPAV